MNALFDLNNSGTVKPENWDGKYNIIYADPPWEFNDKRRNGAADHYSVMNLESLKALDVDEISANDCVLFMWVVFPMLQEGLDLIRAWGFKYKTIAFNWIKTTENNNLFWGEGMYTRSNSEICLLGIKGRPKVISHSVHSVVLSKVRNHSQKPDVVRDRIVQLYGDLPRIELFARDTVLGWDCFGNEVNSNIMLRSKLYDNCKL